MGCTYGTTNKKTYTMADLEKERKILENKIRQDHYPYPLYEDSRKLQSHLKRLLQQFVWANGKIFYNDPKKMKLPKSKQYDTIIDRLHHRVANLKKSLSVEAAYFIPRDEGIAYLKKMRKGGIRVRVLTNSLKSNDVLAAYAGYNSYRKELLQIGVELYELKDDAGSGRIIHNTAAKGNITWTTLENGKKVVYTSEPKAGVWDMFKVHLFQLLPFEKQL